MYFADLHTHLLPGVDDGATTLEETVEMLRIAHRGGTRVMVATPHMFLPLYDGDAARVRERHASLVARLGELAADPEHGFLGEMQVLLGAENYLSPEFLAAVEKGEIVTLNNGSCLLVELPPFLPLGSARTAFERLLDAGYVPLIAHVERYPEMVANPALLAELVALGCLVQINASSVLRGPRRRFCNTLLTAGHVHVVASDGHGAERRLPDLRAVCDSLSKRYEQEQVRGWLWQKPREILYGD